MTPAKPAFPNRSRGARRSVNARVWLSSSHISYSHAFEAHRPPPFVRGDSIPPLWHGPPLAVGALDGRELRFVSLEGLENAQKPVDKQEQNLPD